MRFFLLMALLVLASSCNRISTDPAPQQCMAWKASANDTARFLYSMNSPHPELIGAAARSAVEEKAGKHAIQRCIDLGYW
jgi:hypothetical protein